MNFREIIQNYTKILAEENITVNYSETAETASFSLDNRVITLPTYEYLDEYSNQMLTTHEIAHALYSTRSIEEFDDAVKVTGPWLNIVEDIYIEKCIQCKYNGLRKVFVKGYQTLIDNGLFGEDLTIEKVNADTLMNRVNTYFKCRLNGFSDVKFNSEEQKIVSEIDNFDWTQKNSICEKQVVEFAIKLAELDKKQKENSEENDSEENDSKENKSKMVNLESSDNSDENDSNENNSNENNSESSDNSELSNNSGSTSSSGENNSESSDNSKENNSGSSDNSKSSDNSDDFDEDNLTKNLRKKKEEFYNKVGPCANAVLDYNHIVNNYCGTDYSLLRNTYYEVSNKGSFNAINKINRLAQIVKSTSIGAKCLFEQLKSSRNLKSAKNVSTGSLDCRNLWKYKLDENPRIFKTRKVNNREKNHALVVIIDGSSSMHANSEGTLLNAACLCYTAQKLNIPFEVIFFGNNPLRSSVVTICNEKTFTVEGMLSIAYSKHSNVGVSIGGSTPMSIALCQAIKTVKKYKNNGIQNVNLIMCTDGEPTECRILLHSGIYRYLDDLLYNRVTRVHNTVNVYIDGKKYNINEYTDKYNIYKNEFALNGLITEYLKDYWDCSTQMLFINNVPDYVLKGCYGEYKIPVKYSKVTNIDNKMFDTWFITKSKEFDIGKLNSPDFYQELSTGTKIWANSVIKKIA